jgi:uncharacterized heparinase superfamily protein
VDLRPAPQVRRIGGWVPAAERAPSLQGPRRFRFLNETHDLAETGWDDPGLARLWRYNLHYFDDLTALGAADRAAWHDALITEWVRENPPAAGTGWEPYPTSLRIVNWIKRAWQGRALSAAATHSLAVQVRWLSRRLELHLLGNHLFANAKALVFAGLFFEGAEADAWLRRGRRILADQLPQQILPDGGQFERSPMYHALALEDVLDLCNAAGAGAAFLRPDADAVVAAWRAAIAPMRQWLLAMCHPDGEIGHFNDAAIGIAPPPAALEAYARRLGFPDQHLTAPVTLLRDSGYVRVAQDDSVALLDVGPVGPDHLPGHAHADTLSFELSIAGQRVLVNSGTSVYDAGVERVRQRGTAAHNTVVVDGENSSEVWSAFRVARRARPMWLEVSSGPPVVIRCAHDGYRRLPGRPVHAREWLFGPGSLTVVDRLEGVFRQAQARFHLHPDVAVSATSDTEADVVLPGGRTVRVSVQGGAVRLEQATWRPEFGRSVPNQCLVVEMAGSWLRSEFRWDAPA